MVNTRGSGGRQQSRTSKSVATTPVKTRSTVKLSPPLRNLRSNSNPRKGHRTKPPSLRRCRNSSPQLCDPVVELSSTDSGDQGDFTETVLETREEDELA